MEPELTKRALCCVTVDVETGTLFFFLAGDQFIRVMEPEQKPTMSR